MKYIKKLARKHNEGSNSDKSEETKKKTIAGSTKGSEAHCIPLGT